MMTVWGRENSTNVKKVLWCLEELKITYQRIPAGGKYGLTHDAEYLTMNPNGLIPCLRDDSNGLILWESHTILRYLAAQYGQQTLWTADPTARARGEKWMDWTLSTLTEPFRGVFLSLVRLPPEERDERLIASSIKACEAALIIINATLEKQAWLSGVRLGPADIALGPLVYAMFTLTIDWPALPHLHSWYQRLCKRPAFVQTVMIPLS